jgi:phage baseplate assembly protein W
MTPRDGRHLAFPLHVGADGRGAQVETLEEHVRDAVIQLLLTNPGERPFLPELGGGARRLVFETAGDVTTAMAKAMISQALSRWLGERVTVESLGVEAVDTTITVDLAYRIAGTEDSRRLRFQRHGG